MIHDLMKVVVADVMETARVAHRKANAKARLGKFKKSSLFTMHIQSEAQDTALTRATEAARSVKKLRKSATSSTKNLQSGSRRSGSRKSR